MARRTGLALTVVSLAAVLAAFDAAEGLGKGVTLGTSGPDTMYGGPGPNAFGGVDGNDSLYGFRGNDTLIGGPGDDLIHGGSGGDGLFGDQGYDRLFGSRGDDILGDAYSPDGIVDELVGGPGTDACLAETIDLIRPSCEAVGRDDGFSETDGIRGVVCERRCKILAHRYNFTVYDRNGKVIRDTFG